MPNITCAIAANATDHLNVDVLIASLVLPIGGFVVVSCVAFLAVIQRNARLQTPANLILCSLTVSDLLVGVVSVPMFSAFLFLKASHPDACAFSRLFDVTRYSMYVSAGGSLVQISVFSWDRWEALSQPLKYKTKVTRRKVLTVSGACWVVWIMWLSVILYGMSNRMREICTAVTCCVLVLTPVFFHCALVLTIRAEFRKMTMIPIQRYVTAALLKERRITVTLRYIIGAFLACLLPVMFIWIAYIAGVTSLKRHAFPWAVTLTFFNSCLNPVIYFWRIPGMRSAALRLFCCWCVNERKSRGEPGSRKQGFATGRAAMATRYDTKL
ncbi:histamine H2 receptor [Nematostella vectensis]|uniref:histamine H2 receptor n=1 Tax=Nematostella vectensis TaxID=45351 RepID=UPI00138FD8D3|nr:histamine H2 receptor [Nematostella vectensis]